MKLSERIQADLVAAMKAKDTVRLGVLRLVKSALQNKKIELSSDLSAEQEMQLLKTMQKQRNESIAMFEKGGRSDLVEKEASELEVLRDYLPEQISAEEIERVANEVAESLGASSPKDMGRVMKETMARLEATGKLVDGKLVSAAVRKKLV